MENPSDAQSSRKLAAITSIVVGILVLVAKFFAYRLTGSSALKSDAFESIVNVAAAMVSMFAIVYAGQPADRDHPYGHGKVEYVAAAFEGGFISLAALLICEDAISALIEGVKIQRLGLGLGLNLGAGLVNGFLAAYLYRTGKKHNSKALEADGLHVFTDFLTSLGILAALLLVHFTGLLWLDPVIALVIGFMLARAGYKLVNESFHALLDSEDPALLEKIVAAVNAQNEVAVISIHELRVIRSGRETHIDVHVVVPEFWNIADTHRIVDRFSARLMRAAKLEGEVHSHVDPCKKDYCESCAVEKCPIRVQEFRARIPQTTESVQSIGKEHPEEDFSDDFNSSL